MKVSRDGGGGGVEKEKDAEKEKIICIKPGRVFL